MRWFTRKKQPPTLSEEFITRYWDLKARVDALEITVEETLADLKRRAAALAQAERRLDQKRQAEEPTAEESPFEKVRRLQRHGSA